MLRSALGDGAKPEAQDNDDRGHTARDTKETAHERMNEKKQSKQSQ